MYKKKEFIFVGLIILFELVLAKILDIDLSKIKNYDDSTLNHYYYLVPILLSKSLYIVLLKIYSNKVDEYCSLENDF